jgi:hypothetical protein
VGSGAIVPPRNLHGRRIWIYKQAGQRDWKPGKERKPPCSLPV